MNLPTYLTLFLFGTVIGSFLNVCIYRLPARESVVVPRSRCGNCRTPIRPYDNVPILSYLLLQGRCRACGAAISLRYPLVELLAGLAAVATYALHGWSLGFPVSFAFVCALIVISLIDLDHQIIPNVISVPGIAVGFIAALLVGEPGWRASLAGLLLGGGILWVVSEGYFRLTGREGMGGGDVKLLAMIGAFLGWRAVPVTLLLASLSGTLIGLGVMIARGSGARTPIPFGPFLAAGALCALFFGESLIRWYLGLIAPPV
jgi:leader peptidase (prepilin peptidase)/N-methyltransferase